MIFVTGGTGVLGSQLLFDLTKSQVPIRALYRSEKKRNRLKRFFQQFDETSGLDRFNQIEWIQGNILDIPILEEAMSGCSHVYHCAALVSFHRRDFSRLIRINRKGTANVVNIALTSGVEKLCYVSSTAAIGGSSSVITEETKWKNTPETTGYSMSKYSAEKEVWRGIEEGLKAVIVNPCVILGPGNWNESSLTIFKTLKNGLKYYPPGSNATVDVRDVSEVMIRLMESSISAERYLCIGSNQSFKTLMEEISSQLKVKAPAKLAKRWMVNLARRLMGFFYLFSSKRPSITKETVQSLFSDRSYDCSKVKKAIDFQFRGLSETVAFAIANRMEDQS